MIGPAHLVVAPVLIPLIAGALLLFFDDTERRLKATISIVSAGALLGVAVALVRLAHGDGVVEDARVSVYLLGDWPPPFAINLVLDRLSAMMLLLGAALALPALIFSIGRWHRAGPHFHTLFQFLLMGLNGAFLTGDLFNLFVFFEIMLAASYGLALHGAGVVRVRAGLHYIAINLVASLLFLIGVALIYGNAGTLNMADLAVRIPQIEGEARVMLEAGAAVLGIAFLVKSGMWPLSFWLPTTYSASPAPVSAIFAILSKVGVYVILRLSLLFFTGTPDAPAGFGGDLLFFGGMATIVFGALGVLASQSLGRLAGYSVLVSSGTLLATMGFFETAITAGALYYLVSSTLAISAFFLLVELVERSQDAVANVLAVTMEAYGGGDEEDEEEAEIVGVAIPGTVAMLAVSFAACGIMFAGLPPLPGFIAKFAIFSAMLNPEGLGEGGQVAVAAWWLVALLILSGLASLIAMTRAGIRSFWAPVEVVQPRVLLLEIMPIGALITVIVAISLQAGPVMRYMDMTARNLHAPTRYIDAVLGAPTAGEAQEEADQ